MPLFPDRTLARRLELSEADNLRHYTDAFRSCYPGAHSAGLALDEAWVAYLGPGSPVGRAIGLGMLGPVQAETLEQVERFYVGYGAPIRIDLCPLADATLMTLLAGRDYNIALFKQVWARRLEDLIPFEAPPNPNLRVIEVSDAEVDVWVQVVAAGFNHQNELQGLDASIARPNYAMTNVRCFLAYLAGEPAGGGAVAIDAQRRVATLFSTSTRPAYRQRGVQTALLKARLAFARAAGCQLAMVQTSPGSLSQRNVLRAGFALIYTKPTLERQRA